MADSPGTTDRSNLEKVLEVVYLYHGGDRDKVNAWLREPHAQLGGETPIEMIRTDRMDTLVDLLRMMVAELEAKA